MKEPRQLSLDEWEELLDKGPVYLKIPLSGTITIAKRSGKYSYRTEWLGSIVSLETVCDTLLQLFLSVLFQGNVFADPLTVDADSAFVAMLPGGD